jgi:hypothetical protein
MGKKEGQLKTNQKGGGGGGNKKLKVKKVNKKE